MIHNGGLGCKLFFAVPYYHHLAQPSPPLHRLINMREAIDDK